MRPSTLIGLSATFASAVFAQCTKNLLVDDFKGWKTNTNSLNDWTSDDGTMSSISVNSNGALSFKPKSNSYFYESFPCQPAQSGGYSGISFSIKGPSKGSVVIELQTRANCKDGSYSSSYYQVTGLTGSTQTVTLPFTDFSGAHADAVSAISWSGFSSTTTTWELNTIAFVCSNKGASSSPAASTPAQTSSKSSSVVLSTSRSSTVIVSSSVASSASKTSSAASSSSPVASTSKSSSTPVSSSSSKSSSVSSSSSKSSSVSSTSTKLSTSSSTSKASSTLSSSKTSTVSSSSVVVTVASATPSGTCQNLLIDDWVSQSRLTFLFYNAMDYPTSDDGTCKSLTVGKPSANHLEIVPAADGSSYFYSQFPCVKAKNTYGGISLRIKAPKGATLSVELDSSSTCDPTNAKAVTVASQDLGWTFDGTEKLYSIPFNKFQGLDTDKLVTVLFSGMSTTFDFGPMAFYCGDKVSEYVATPLQSGPENTATVPAPANPSATALVVDKFTNADSNALGNWHGMDDGMNVKYANNKVTISSNDSDLAYYTQLSSKCTDYTKYQGSYLHVAYSGSTKFTISLQQHNPTCDDTKSPSPETWDSAEAARYAKDGHIYIPMNHFKIDLTRTIGLAFKGFYTTDPVTLSVVEIVPSVPSGFTIPAKDETGSLIFSCKRPNSFAFAIDDGTPDLAQQVLQIVREENIKVTFFTVGAPLLDASTNLTNVYREMKAAGHQLAMHTYTHPKMEGLPDYASIDWEYDQDVKAMKSQFDGFTTKYFRPPFGTEGARMRSRLTRAVGNDAQIAMWSVDVEDWMWAMTNTPEQQKVSFQRDVNAGGNLVVMHYLYPSTVSYLRDFIKIAKATGKQLMRVDQCMMDPDAPPL